MNFADGPRVFGNLLQHLPVRVRTKSCPCFGSGLFAGVSGQVAEIGGKRTNDRLPDEDGLDAAVEKDGYLTVIEHMDFQVPQSLVGTFIDTELKNAVRVLQLLVGTFSSGMQSIATNNSLSIR